MRWVVSLALGAMLAASTSAAAATQCDRLLGLLGHQIADASRAESADPHHEQPRDDAANNSLLGFPALAFTPQTDRAVISPTAHTPITKTVPGIQLDGRIADDPTGEARILFRLPNEWNGKLVVAGASGTRSEFNGDFAWSDYVPQQGYAYVSQNKCVLNLYLTTAADPDGDWKKLRPAYRLFEVQNGNHIETYKDTFPQLELIQPHAQRAFDLLSDSVEHGSALPRRTLSGMW